MVALAVPQALWVLVLAASLAHADGAMALAEQLVGRAAMPWVFIAGFVLLAVLVPVASLAAAWVTRQTLFGREQVGAAEQGIWCAAVVLLAALAASAFTPLLWLILPSAAGALLAVPPRTARAQSGPR